MPVTCPKCGSRFLRDSKPQSAAEKMGKLRFISPLRCLDCKTRFVTRTLILSDMLYARCPKCQRMDLNTWNPSNFTSRPWTNFKVALGAKRFRCEYCRVNFASFRKRKEIFTFKRWIKTNAGKVVAEGRARFAEEEQRALAQHEAEEELARQRAKEQAEAAAKEEAEEAAAEAAAEAPEKEKKGRKLRFRKSRAEIAAPASPNAVMPDAVVAPEEDHDGRHPAEEHAGAAPGEDGEHVAVEAAALQETGEEAPAAEPPAPPVKKKKREPFVVRLVAPPEPRLRMNDMLPPPPMPDPAFRAQLRGGYVPPAIEPGPLAPVVPADAPVRRGANSVPPVALTEPPQEAVKREVAKNAEPGQKEEVPPVIQKHLWHL